MSTATKEKDRAWLYELIGPIQTLLAVRTSGQRERAETELTFIERLWDANGVNVRAFEFGFEGKAPPLSWQLSPVERQNIETQWTRACNTLELARLLALVKTAEQSAAVSQDTPPEPAPDPVPVE